MRKLSLFVAAVAASLAFAGAAKALPSSGAAPLGTVTNAMADRNPAAATQVQYRRYYRYRHRHWRPYRHYYRPYRPYYYGYYGYRPYRWHRHHYWRRYW